MPWKNYDPIVQMPQWYNNVSNEGVIIPTTDDLAYILNRDFKSITYVAFPSSSWQSSLPTTT